MHLSQGSSKMEWTSKRSQSSWVTAASSQPKGMRTIARNLFAEAWKFWTIRRPRYSKKEQRKSRGRRQEVHRLGTKLGTLTSEKAITWLFLRHNSLIVKVKTGAPCRSRTCGTRFRNSNHS